MLYGTPRDPASTLHPGYIKIGLHGRPDILVDPSMSSPVVTQAEQQELIEATRLSLHCEPNIALAKPCLYTMSPDTHFVLGKPMEYNHVVAVSGLSGHGFKMTPALGEILCDMVLGQDYSKWNVKSILSDRFHVKN
jgi:sarcosine oxidase